MNTKIQKWGNSLAIRIPKGIAEDAGIKQGSLVDLGVRDGKLVIETFPEPVYTLEELLKGVTKKNLHAEVDTGAPVGREEW